MRPSKDRNMGEIIEDQSSNPEKEPPFRIHVGEVFGLPNGGIDGTYNTEVEGLVEGRILTGKINISPSEEDIFTQDLDVFTLPTGNLQVTFQSKDGKIAPTPETMPKTVSILVRGIALDDYTKLTLRLKIAEELFVGMPGLIDEIAVKQEGGVSYLVAGWVEETKVVDPNEYFISLFPPDVLAKLEFRLDYSK